jgi:hypothetical protein
LALRSSHSSLAFQTTDVNGQPKLVDTGRIRLWRHPSSKNKGGIGTEEKELGKADKKEIVNGAGANKHENGVPDGPLQEIVHAAENVTEAANEVLHEMELATETIQSFIDEVPAPIAPASEQKAALMTVAFWVSNTLVCEPLRLRRDLVVRAL